MKHSTRRSSLGFTLIELLIAVAILGIITAFAYPSYSGYVLKSKTGEAKATLSELRLRNEQYYQANRTYDDGAGNCAVVSPTLKYFTFTCVIDPSSNGNNKEYRWTASNKANVGLGSAGSFSFNIDEEGDKQTTVFKGSTFATPKTCWLSRSSNC